MSRLSTRVTRLLLQPLFLAGIAVSCAGTASAQSLARIGYVPSVQEAAQAKEDVWGEMAVRLPNGPNYAFFARVAPPMRYVNAAFRHYPVVLCAPGSPAKARVASNGAGVNLAAESEGWKETGFPVVFRVGPTNELFGGKQHALDGPALQTDGLPIMEFNYQTERGNYRQEVLPLVEEPFAAHGVLIFQFDVNQAKTGIVSAAILHPGPLTATNHAVLDAEGRPLVWFDDVWTWNPEEKTLRAGLEWVPRQSAYLMIASRTSPKLPASVPLTDVYFNRKKNACVAFWESRLIRGLNIKTPEAEVTAAARASVIHLFNLINSRQPFRSAGNADERVDARESAAMLRPLMLWGYAGEIRPAIQNLLLRKEPGKEHLDAGTRLELLALYHRLTRDPGFIRETRPYWIEDAERIINGRDAGNGLAPKQNYGPGAAVPVFSLGANAVAWRGLRDMAVAVSETGDTKTGLRMAGAAQEFRASILAAVAQNEIKDFQPPFVPMSLFGNEQPYDPLTATPAGCCWSLTAPLVLGSGVFGPGSERDGWILDYLHRKGGVCMGMIRFRDPGLFAGADALSDIAASGYMDALFRLDQADRALAGFYGKLAQGMTRGSFVSAAGAALKPEDGDGRLMNLPPNGAGNAAFLCALRQALVQDLDTDDDGKPDTLRLLFATPRAWLEDDKSVRVEKAPTAFGEVSVEVTSLLRRNQVTAVVQIPKQNTPRNAFIRFRLPDGWNIVSAVTRKNTKLDVDSNGTVDIGGCSGLFTVHLKVEKPKPAKPSKR